jgi:hypothetical protein
MVLNHQMMVTAGGPGAGPSVGHNDNPDDPKRLRRREKGREYTRKCRARKREAQEKLQESNKKMRSENEALSLHLQCMGPMQDKVVKQEGSSPFDLGGRLTPGMSPATPQTPGSQDGTDTESLSGRGGGGIGGGDAVALQEKLRHLVKTRVGVLKACMEGVQMNEAKMRAMLTEHASEDLKLFIPEIGTLSGRDRWLDYVAQMYAHMPDYSINMKRITLEDDGTVVEDSSFTTHLSPATTSAPVMSPATESSSCSKSSPPSPTTANSNSTAPPGSYLEGICLTPKTAFGRMIFDMEIEATHAHATVFDLGRPAGKKFQLPVSVFVSFVGNQISELQLSWRDGPIISELALAAAKNSFRGGTLGAGKVESSGLQGGVPSSSATTAFKGGSKLKKEPVDDAAAATGKEDAATSAVYPFLYIPSFLFIPLYSVLHIALSIFLPLCSFRYIHSFVFRLLYSFFYIHSFIFRPLHFFFYIPFFIFIPLYSVFTLFLLYSFRCIPSFIFRH